MAKTKKENLNILIEPGLKEHLKVLAADENRNLSNLVETALKRLVAASQRAKKEENDLIEK